MSNIPFFFFGSTADFAFNAFYIQYTLVSFNDIASFQPFFFLLFKSTFYVQDFNISFNAIYSLVVIDQDCSV